MTRILQVVRQFLAREYEDFSQQTEFVTFHRFRHGTSIGIVLSVTKAPKDELAAAAVWAKYEGPGDELLEARAIPLHELPEMPVQ